MAAQYFISKLYRQHTSVVMVLPRPVQIALDLKFGDHVVLQWKNPDGVFVLQKFVPVGAQNGRDTEHTNQPDQSRNTQTEIRG